MNKELEKLKSCLYDIFRANGFDDTNASAAAAKWSMIPAEPCEDIKVRILKGGTYKIKGYYLEDNDLNDIRGASALITYVQEKLIPDLIKEKYGDNSIIYNGGGNVFALIPENAPDHESFPLMLEQAAERVLVSCNVAYFISEPIALSQLLGQGYAAAVSKCEEQLAQRRKLKVMDSVNRSSFYAERGIALDGVSIPVDVYKGAQLCEKCRNRPAGYIFSAERVCAGCLHKSVYGREQKGAYRDLFSNITKKEPKEVRMLDDIDREIAVVYGDGNNMGGIIASFEHISEMMRFSDYVRETMPKVVFGAMRDAGISAFEVVGLGGDDVFVIVPAQRALQFSAKLVKRYKEAFSSYSAANCTLSAGVALSKKNTPIKVLLEKAEEELARAKTLAKHKECGGTLSYVFVDSLYGENVEREERTLLPYTIETADIILDYAARLKAHDAARSRLINISEAFRTADSHEEASLFYAYVNAKESKERNRIFPPEIDGYTLKGGYYTDENGARYLWDDLLDLLDYCAGGKDEKDL